MNDYWWPGGWIRGDMGELRFYRAQEMKEGAWSNDVEPDIVIGWRDYYLLKRWMIENDKDSIVHTNRDEDLKVIHRLLDIVQSLSGKAKGEEE